MTMSATATAAPPRRLGRSVAALFFGFVTVVVLSLVTDEVLHLLKVYPPWSQPMYDSGLCLLALSYRIVYTVLGSYIAARYAPYAPMGHALILGVVGRLSARPGRSLPSRCIWGHRGTRLPLRQRLCRARGWAAFCTREKAPTINRCDVGFASAEGAVSWGA